VKNSEEKAAKSTAYPEFHQKERRLWTFIKQFTQATSFVRKLIGNLSNINRLQQHSTIQNVVTSNRNILWQFRVTYMRTQKSLISRCKLNTGLIFTSCLLSQLLVSCSISVRSPKDHSKSFYQNIHSHKWWHMMTLTYTATLSQHHSLFTAFGILYSNLQCTLLDISKRYITVILASRTGSEYVTLLPMWTNKCCPLY